LLSFLEVSKRIFASFLAFAINSSFCFSAFFSNSSDLFVVSITFFDSKYFKIQNELSHHKMTPSNK
jgi:hypothetical protein